MWRSLLLSLAATSPSHAAASPNLKIIPHPSGNSPNTNPPSSPNPSPLQQTALSLAFDAGKLGAYPNRTYISEPLLQAPKLNVLRHDERCDDGLYTMISLRGDKVALSGQSPMIFDGKGELVWMNTTYGETFGLGVQRYRGEDYLTFWKGDDSVGGHGEGYYYMLDSNYNEAFILSAGNNKPGDLHEFRITPEGTALITQYLLEEALFENAARRNRKGYIWDSVIQEVDIATNRVLFEWHASDHFDIDESDFSPGNAGRAKDSGYDFFHINSIEKDIHGNYLISSRYYQSLTYINGSSPTGEILWHLGGKKNSFRDLSDGKATHFGWQHDARFHYTGNQTFVTLFDNGARYGLKSTVKSSRGVTIRLDLVHMTAAVVAEFVNPRGVISASQGSMQILPSGNVLLGFGYNAAWTEFLPSGEAICDVHIGSQKTFDTGAVQTYHVKKYPWIGRPSTTPKIMFKEGEVHMSWNGATEIKSWVLETSMNEDMEGNKNSILDIGMVERTGFETKMGVDCHRWPYVRAVAVDVKGKRLGVSEVVKTDCGWEIDRTVYFYFLGLKIAVPSLRRMVMGFVGCGVVIWGLLRWRLRRRGYIAIGSKMDEWDD